MRVYLIVEGHTEEAVTKEILKPHFDAMGIYLTPIIVSTARVSGRKHKGGGRRWIKWKNDIDRILREQKGPEVRVTTLWPDPKNRF